MRLHENRDEAICNPLQMILTGARPVEAQRQSCKKPYNTMTVNKNSKS